MTDKTKEPNYYRLAQLILIGMAVQLAVIFYVFISTYQGRKDLVDSQRAGCGRGLLDRTANAQGWRIAEGARLAEGDIGVAAKYNTIASGLEDRSHINCEDAYPKVSIFP